MRSLNFGVPGDVSVAGFDGIEIGRMVTPTLATIATPNCEMGERAMRRLLALVSGSAPADEAVELLPYEFRPGGTLAPVPAEKAGGGERRRPRSNR